MSRPVGNGRPGRRPTVVNLTWLIERVQQTPQGCWLWQAAIDPDGYGVASVAGRTWRAHRLAYTHLVAPIPPGALVLHACHNRACCAPRHLRLGTHAENMADMAAAGRARRRPYPDELGSLVRRDYRAGDALGALATRYDLDRDTVARMLEGIKRRHRRDPLEVTS